MNKITLAGHGKLINGMVEKREDGIIIRCNNGFNYTLSETDFAWLKSTKTPVKPFPYILDLKAVSFVIEN
jgi:hypothetical protein